MKKEAKKFIVSEDLLVAIARYLSEKPFREVHVLLQAIQGLPDYVEPVLAEGTTGETKQDVEPVLAKGTLGKQTGEKENGRSD